jgi:CTP synthase (UTP-ammonia lyase)
MSIHIGIVGDFEPGFEPHTATDAAIAHIVSVGLPVEAQWLPTPSLESSSELEGFHGLWVAPGSPYKSLVGALSAIRHAREQLVPLLGTCGGFQHIILEYARHVLGFSDAADAEYDPYSSKLFISRLVCSLVGRSLLITLKPESLVAKIYGRVAVTEQYYCNFGVNPDHVSTLDAGPLRIVGSDAEDEVRVVELAGHPFFVGTLFVPQLRSAPGQPHPLILGFVRAAERYATQQRAQPTSRSLRSRRG